MITKTIWEYNVVLMGDYYAHENALNAWGAAGWELVTINGNLAYFKRPKN